MGQRIDESIRYFTMGRVKIPYFPKEIRREHGMVIGHRAGAYIDAATTALWGVLGYKAPEMPVQDVALERDIGLDK